MPGRHRPLVVDACVAINVRATGRWGEIFTTAQWQPIMTTFALQEVIYLFDEDGERQRIALDAEEAVGLVSQSLNDRQLTLMLQLVPSLGPGEASSLALAQTEEFAFATDDHAASNHELARANSVVGTTQLIRTWAEKTAGEKCVKDVILLIDSRSRFRPGASDPNHSWWLSRL